jgi:glutathione S-transferase
MITIWGRANSVNVQKILWLCDEIALSYNRIDAGLQFGRNTEPGYLAMNPMGKVPTLVDGNFVLWESNSILRYLVMQYGGASPLYPADPKARASIDRWLDWALSTLQPAERPVFWGIIRTSESERDTGKVAADVAKVAEVWRVLDTQLNDRDFIEGESFTIADIVLGAFAKRWFGLPGIARPRMPNLER